MDGVGETNRDGDRDGDVNVDRKGTGLDAEMEGTKTRSRCHFLFPGGSTDSASHGAMAVVAGAITTCGELEAL